MTWIQMFEKRFYTFWLNLFFVGSMMMNACSVWLNYDNEFDFFRIFSCYSWLLLYFYFFFLKDKFYIKYWNVCQGKNRNYYAFKIRVLLCKLSQAYIQCIFLKLHIEFKNKHSFLYQTWMLTVAWQWLLNYIKVHNKMQVIQEIVLLDPNKN